MTDVQHSRKFRPTEDFQGSKAVYYLMPFRFLAVNDDHEILVNEVGDYLWAPRGTAQSLASHHLKPTNPLYPDLIARSFIAENPLDSIDILATRYRTKKSFLDHFTSLHIFVPTLRCNHSCHYCQVSRQTADRTNFDMTLNHMDLAIGHMFSSPSQYITMEFQGGEPLLAFHLVQYGVLRAKELNISHKKRLTFVICTNLSLLDDGILAFCREHEILLSTSLDGPDWIHDKNRPRQKEEYPQTFEEQLAKARAFLGFDRISALMTTSRLSLDYPCEIIDEYLKLKFDGIFLRPISPYGFALKSKTKNFYDTESFLDFYFKGLNYILELNKQGIPFREEYAAILLRKILTPFPVTYVDLQSPAGMVTGVVVFNYNGKVYATDESRMLAEQGDHQFCIGHVEDSYEDLLHGPKVHELFETGVNESLAGCSDCAFQPYCGADPVFHYATQGDPAGYRPTSSFCKRQMRIILYLLNALEQDKETASILRRWAAQ